MFTFTFTFAKRRIRPPNAYQEVSNTNHFGFVSDSLGRLATVSECRASKSNMDNKYCLLFSESLPERLKSKNMNKVGLLFDGFINESVYCYHQENIGM